MSQKEQPKQQETITKFKINKQVNELITSSTIIDQPVKDKLLTRQWISINDLQSLLKAKLASSSVSSSPSLKEKKNNQPSSNDDITTLLANLSFYIPEKRKVPQTDEFKARLQKLRILNEEKEYQRLIRSEQSIYEINSTIGGSSAINIQGNDDDDESAMLTASQFNKQVKEQLTTIVNVFVTCGSAAFAVWYWTKTSMHVKESTRVFLSLFVGLVVLIAEVVVYNSYLRKMDEAKKVERRKKEIKKVIETIVIKKENQDVMGELEKEKTSKTFEMKSIEKGKAKKAKKVSHADKQEKILKKD